MLQAGRSSLLLRLLQAELFYFATKKIGIGRSSLLRPGQAPHDQAAGGPFYFATKKIGVGRGAVATTTAAGGTVLLCRHDGAASILDFKPRLANRCSLGVILGRNRAVILDFKPRLANRCSLGADLWQNRASILDFRLRLANRCSRGAILGRNRAVILDFRPRLANRCSQEAKTRAILASILDFKPRLANRCSLGADLWQNRALILDFKPRLTNRCSQEAKTRANRASILEFKPRLANRCSKEVKTGAIPPSQGLKHCAAAGECRMGRDFGRRSRPWLREREGPAAQRWEGKHRRCAPVRSPCPQAESAAGTAPARRQIRPQSRNN